MNEMRKARIYNANIKMGCSILLSYHGKTPELREQIRVNNIHDGAIYQGEVVWVDEERQIYVVDIKKSLPALNMIQYSGTSKLDTL